MVLSQSKKAAARGSSGSGVWFSAGGLGALPRRADSASPAGSASSADRVSAAGPVPPAGSAGSSPAGAGAARRAASAASAAASPASAAREPVGRLDWVSLRSTAMPSSIASHLCGGRDGDVPDG